MSVFYIHFIIIEYVIAFALVESAVCLKQHDNQFAFEFFFIRSRRSEFYTTSEKLDRTGITYKT
jgi:hypothetical protein